MGNNFLPKGLAEMIWLVILISIFFAFTVFYIARKSLIFSLGYFLLFLYTFFTQIGYLLYPSDVAIVSAGQYYGSEIFLSYWLFVAGSLLAIFIVFGLLDRYTFPVRIGVKFISGCISSTSLSIVVWVYTGLMLWYLVKNYDWLSYYSQAILKGNKIWFWLFSAYGIIVLTCVFSIYLIRPWSKKLICLLGLTASTVVFGVTSVKSGQRIEAFTTVLGLLGFILSIRSEKRSTRWRKWVPIIFLLGIFGIFSQAVRTARGFEDVFSAFVTTLTETSRYLVDFKELVFQDWLMPSLSLMTSIHNGIIFPDVVIRSNLICLIPFIQHNTLGGIFSRLVDPYGTAGYGYYILTEGYNVAGFGGIIYNGLVFGGGLWVLENLFARSQNRFINAYMSGMICFLLLNVVRGQSMFLIKGLFMYVLPALLLLRAFGIKISIIKRARYIGKEDNNPFKPGC